MKTKKKNNFPSKKEIIKTLLKEEQKADKFEKIILIIEHQKINSQLGMINGEFFQNGKIVLKGSMTCMLRKAEEDSFDWNILKVGESYFDGFSLDYKRGTIGSLIKEGIKKGIREGKIPFLK